MSISIEVDTRGFERELQKISRRSEAAVNQGFREVAGQIQIDAYDKVPNDTRNLVRSYKYFIRGLEMEAGYNVVYAAYQHRGRRADGTRIIRNRPAGGQTKFLANTINDRLDNYIDIIKNQL